MAAYYFVSQDGEHSENAQEMLAREAIAHAKKSANYLGQPIKVYKGNKLVRVVKPTKTSNPGSVMARLRKGIRGTIKISRGRLIIKT